ncbi:MAG: ComF family protein [Alphaproteobacteria bacterium]|nr:ComF family protein [Alphaproteobacteria bacterium]
MRLAIRLGRIALDALLPPLCLACGEPVGDPGGLCPPCWDGMRFLGPPFCACCGAPFETPAPDGALCGACMAEPPPFRRARAVFDYDEAGRGLILRFKHADRTDAAPGLARWMSRAGAELLAQADLLVPVPMHRLRLFQRTYNQAAMLARELSRLSGVAFAPEALSRGRATPSQGRMGRVERIKNVRGAFAPGRNGDLVRGRAVLLIDDVLTTGATASECARALRKAGAASVDVLTVARVGR